jgi:hypothetical protein
LKASYSVKGGRRGIYIRMGRSEGLSFGRPRVASYLPMMAFLIASPVNAMLSFVAAASASTCMKPTASIVRFSSWRRKGKAVSESARRRCQIGSDCTHGAVTSSIETHAVFQVGGTVRWEIFALRAGISRRLLGRNEYIAVLSAQTPLHVRMFLGLRERAQVQRTLFRTLARAGRSRSKQSRK